MILDDSGRAHSGSYHTVCLRAHACSAPALAFAVAAWPSADARPPASPAHAPPTLTLHPTRQALDDLEVTGMLKGLAAGGRAYVSYAQLRSLPQVTVHVVDDENFVPSGSALLVGGIPLEVLARALGALPGSDLIDALCNDDYRAHYPASYIALHHPIFALTINRQRAAAWAALAHQYDPSPYFLTHAHFVPTVNVLAHKEQPQVPTNVIRLHLSTVAATYGAITPRGPLATTASVQQGFAIAKQSCLRCHDQGDIGGTKAARSWFALSTWAREQPAFFQSYVHNPQSFETHAHMPANPHYDRATLAALTAYFSTFTAGQASSATQ